MSWFTRSRSAAEPAAATGHQSQALRALVDSLSPGSRHAVLDLGPPLAGNVRFLSALSCRVRIVDLHRALAAESLASRQPGALGALFERLLPLAPDERFDALLAWDVFDYMRPDQVSALMARLTPTWRPEARALVMLSTRRYIPARPARYRIVDRENVACDDPQQTTRACTQYTQADLARMMPGFSVRRSLLLRSGIQEYLLAFDAGAGAARTRGVGAAPGAATGRAWFRRSS